MIKQTSLVLLCIAVWASSCASSTRVTSSWVKPTADAVGAKKVMVVALVGENRNLRQQMEGSLAADLKKAGYDAVSSFAEFGPEQFDASNETQALQQIKERQADAVLTVVLLDMAKERAYVPGRVQYSPFPYYNRFGGYYSTLQSRLYTPGYYTTNTSFFWESNLYNMAGDLVYSAQTKSFNPSSAGSVSAAQSHAIVKDMMLKGLLRKD